MLKTGEDSKEYIGITRDLKRNGLSLGISLLVHAILIISIFFIFPSEEFRIFENVTDVIIVPPEKLFIPERMEPASGPESKVPLTSVPDKTPGLEESEESSQELMTSPEIKAEFRLEIPSKSQPESKFDDRPHFSLKLPSPDMVTGKNYRNIPKDLDLLKYLYPDQRGIIRRTGKAGGTSGLLRSVWDSSSDSRGFNITPWAEYVVARIQKNWFISPDREIGKNAVFRVLLIVEKNGELQSFELLETSGDELLDKAALNALDSSSPFPKLPDEFLEKTLTIELSFKYYD